MDLSSDRFRGIAGVTEQDEMMWGRAGAWWRVFAMRRAFLAVIIVRLVLCLRFDRDQAISFEMRRGSCVHTVVANHVGHLL
jgi:hypothetical protein